MLEPPCWFIGHSHFNISGDGIGRILNDEKTIEMWLNPIKTLSRSCTKLFGSFLNKLTQA